jgi:hypothetical protein
MRKEILVLLFLVGMASAVSMMATMNATVYLYPEIGKTTQYTLKIFGNEENLSANVTLMFDGEVGRYATVQDSILMEANPSGKCCEWYPIILTVTIPENMTDEIKGDLYAVVKQCEGVAGSCQEFPMMKHLVLRPKEPLNVASETEIPSKNGAVSEVNPITNENASIDNFEYAPLGLATAIILAGAVIYVTYKNDREVKNDEKRRD